MTDYSKDWADVFPEACSKTGGRLLASAPQDLKNKVTSFRIEQVHLGKGYEYSRLLYKDSKTNVIVTCPEHGDWSATPNNLISKESGCPKCAGRVETLAEFETLARRVHGGKFKYLSYIAMKEPANIECPVHGIFQQTPQDHLKAVTGCKKCGVEKRSDSSRLSTVEALVRCVEVHGGRYDLSKVKYVGASEKIIVVCAEHGEFYPSYSNFVYGKTGCPTCAGNQKRTLEEFVRKASDVHGNKYNYSLVNYVNKESVVKIICPEHGEFVKAPNHHLNGSGCQKCSTHRASTHVYLLDYGNDIYKVGVTLDLYGHRLQQLTRSYGGSISVIGLWQVDNPLEVEALLLSRYKTNPSLKRTFDGSTELRILNLDQVREIVQYMETLNASI